MLKKQNFMQDSSKNFIIREKMNQTMFDVVPKQGESVHIIYKSGRVEYEINSEFFKNSNEGVVIGDLYGYISDVNDNIVTIFGAKDKSDFIGKNVLEFLVKEERAIAVQKSLASIANQKGMTQQYLVRLINGEETKLEVTTNFIKDEQRQIIGFIDFIRRSNGAPK